MTERKYTIDEIRLECKLNELWRRLESASGEEFDEIVLQIDQVKLELAACVVLGGPWP